MGLMKLIQRFNGNEAEKVPSLDRQYNTLVAGGNPSYFEIRRRGEGWTVQTTTLFAPLVAIPTTTAILELYNNSANRLIVVSDVFAMHVLATAVVQTHAIFAGVTTQKAAPTLTALNVHSLSGKELKVPTATSELITGVGTTIISNGWRPLGTLQNFNLGAATPGESWNVPVDGKIVVPPGASAVFHVAGALATASSFQMGVDFDWINAVMES